MITVELVKLARRPRNWVSVALLCGLPIVVAIFVAVTHVAPPPGQGPTLLSAVLSDGALFPAAALAIVLPIFLPIAVAVVAGDAIAGEASAGMLRYLLARPVPRTRLLIAKLVALVAYVVLAVVAVAATSYVTGRLLFGSKPAAVTSSGITTTNVVAASLSGTALTPADVLVRTAGVVAFIVVSMLGVGAIALFLSTIYRFRAGCDPWRAGCAHHQRRPGGAEFGLRHQPLPADPVLALVGRLLPAADPVADIDQGFEIQAVYVVVFVAAAWANFASKDITS